MRKTKKPLPAQTSTAPASVATQPNPASGGRYEIDPATGERRLLSPPTQPTPSNHQE